MGKNGYEKSVLQTKDGECYLCGKLGPTERHEVFPAAMRDKSKRTGAWVALCPYCHRMAPWSPHQSEKYRMQLQQEAQRAVMKARKWTLSDWMREFYKSYL